MKSKLIISAATILLIIGLGGCLALKNPPMDNSAIDTYQEISKQSGSAAGATERAAGIDRWKALLAELSEENIRGKVGEVYAEKTFFNDTLKTLRGPEKIEEYLLETAAMLKYGRVSYEDAAESGDDVYIRWRMVYRSKKLRKDEDIITIGMSHLRFDSEGKVILHQDFWDSTRGLFEHVPVLGTGIRAIKKRL